MPATADPFDDACTAPANPITPPSPTSTVSLIAGQTLVIAAGTSFQGGINALPTGAQICIAATATFNPQFVNNADGSIFNRGNVTMPGLSVGGGFVLDNTGSVTFASNLNTNGTAKIRNGAGGTMTFNQYGPLNNSSTLVNEGQVAFQSGLGTDNGTVLDNSGTITVAADFVPNGTVLNTGRITVGGSLTTNSGAVIRNRCSIVVTGGLTNNADLGLSGTIVIGASASFVNQGRLSLDNSAAISGGSFTNNAQVNGSGRFFFTGNTTNQGPFNGASPTTPLNFFDTTPTTGGIFDITNQLPTNTIRQSFTPPDGSTVSPGCAAAGADVSTTKTGPATITAGASFSYVITVGNSGPLAATSVVVTDTLPAGVTVTSAGGGTVGAGVVTWNIASLAVGASQTFTLTVGTTTSTTGPLVNVVGSTAATPDSNPGNNDGSSASARVTTTVVPAPPPNRPPVAINQERNTHTLVPVVGVMTATDPDAGQTLTWQTTLVTSPIGGAATIDPTGHFSYQAAVSFTGIDFFEARVCDNGSPVLCAVGRVTLLVSPDPVPDAATTTTNTPVTIPVSDNDVGPATPPELITAPLHGTAIVNPDRTITYTPATGFTGLDTFAYRICAPSAPTVCDGTTVTVSVQEPPNRPPVVGDVAVQTIVDHAVTFDVPTSDPDAGQVVTLTTTPVSGPSDGSVVIGPGTTVVYTPDANFAGIDSLVVQGCDSASVPLCSTGSVVVSVLPEALNDVGLTAIDTAVTVNVRANDRGTIGVPVVISHGPSGATAVVNGDGTITYTPPPGFTGTGEAVYRVCSSSASALCDTARLVVFVEPPPNSPPEVDDVDRTINANTTLSLTVSAFDPDTGDVVEFDTVPFSGPSNGTATIAVDGSFTYVPDVNFTGLDTVVVTACDPSNQCSQGTITITIMPVARDDTVSTFAGVPVVTDVRANDSGDTGPPVILVAPSVGTAGVQADGTLLFTPEPNQVGIVGIAYRVCSTLLTTACDNATVTVFISPRAVPDSAITGANQPVVVDAGANDSGDANLIVVTSPPQHGTVVNEGGGLFTYTPAPGFTGIDVFEYNRCDAFSRLCTSAPVTVTVLPSVFDDSATTFEDVPTQIPVLANDVGAFANPHITATPPNGSVVVVGDQVVYAPNSGFVGEDVFTYSSCSPLRITFCSSAFVRVTVLAADPPPTTTTTTTTLPPIPPPTPPTTVPPDILPPFPPTSSTPRQLAVTGADTKAPIGLAIVASALGLGLLVVSRRPRRG